MNAVLTASNRVLLSRFSSDRGASLIEYSLLVVLIAIVSMAAITAIGQATNEPLSEVGSGFGG